MSEAVYLRDPHDNGIELYVDRPREQWPPPTQPGERVGMYTIGLDLNDLMSIVEDEDARPRAGPGLRTGHLHLHVGDIGEGLVFYRDVLGFEVMVNLGNAAFVSAGGYHHHLGFNVWMGRDVMPPPPGTVGLRHWTVVLDGAKQVAAVRARVQAAGLPIEKRGAAGGFLVRDPWRIAVAFEPVPVAERGNAASRNRYTFVTPIAAVAWRHGATLLAHDADLDRLARVIGIRVDPASRRSQ